MEKIRSSNIPDFIFSMNIINAKNLKKFKIFDLTSIWMTYHVMTKQ